MSQEELVENDFNDDDYFSVKSHRNNGSDQNAGVIGKADKDVELSSNNSQPRKNLKYPKSIFFIFSNEFCERYSYYGMRTILSLYLISRSGLMYDEQTATIVYHTFVMLCYFTPLIGGIIADAWIGKYKTIFYVSIIYALGNVALTIGALPEPGIPHRVLALLGLFLIGAGTGGIKPCVSSFGGDQFVVPEQQKQLDRYFSVFYFSINAGSVLSCFFSPVLREMSCLGRDTCYPLAFGIPAVLMILSIICFVAGKRMYKMKEPEGSNIAIEVCKCIGHALSRKIMSKEKKTHWLEYAEDKYSRKLIEETKILLNICLLFTPTIVFWSLYEQQGSKWTYQANRMDGRLGSVGIILPDQMQTLNAVLVLIFIPLFEYIVYPICDKLHLIRTSLQKICWGGFVAGISFVLSGILQFYINTSNPVFPNPGEAQLRVYNNLNCTLELFPEHFQSDPIKTSPGPVIIPPYLDYMDLTIPAKNTRHILTSISSNCPHYINSTGTIELNNEKASSYFIMANSSNFLELFALNTRGYKELDKHENGNPKIKVLYNLDHEVKLKFTLSDKATTLDLDPQINGSLSHQTVWNGNLTTGIYDIAVDDYKLGRKVNFEPGAVYMFMLVNQSQGSTQESWDYELFTLTPANNVSILWQTPQYVAISAAEILLSITGMEFSYNQSPDSMKSFVSSLWLVTDSFGNIIVLIIEGIDIFTNQAYTYFLFAGLMTVVMLIFVVLAINYKQPDFEVDENNRVVIRGTSTIQNQPISEPN